MAKKTFDLRALAPERPTVNDFQGNPHTVKLPDDFGLTDYARLMDLHKKFANITQVSIETLTVESAEEAEDTLAELLLMIVPTLPEGDKAQMSFRVKMQLIEWWMGEIAPQGKVEAAQEAPQTPTPSTS